MLGRQAVWPLGWARLDSPSEVVGTQVAVPLEVVAHLGVEITGAEEAVALRLTDGRTPRSGAAVAEVAAVARRLVPRP